MMVTLYIYWAIVNCTDLLVKPVPYREPGILLVGFLIEKQRRQRWFGS